MVLLPAPAGLAAAWQRSGIDDPQELRKTRIRQALVAGAMAGLVGGMAITFTFGWFPMLIEGPVFGLAASGSAALRQPTTRARPGPATSGISVSSYSSPEGHAGTVRPSAGHLAT